MLSRATWSKILLVLLLTGLSINLLQPSAARALLLSSSDQESVNLTASATQAAQLLPVLQTQNDPRDKIEPVLLE